MKTSDAALLVGVTDATIRQWKRRGYLAAEFTARDVWRCAADRMPARWHAQLDDAWRQVEHSRA